MYLPFLIAAEVGLAAYVIPAVIAAIGSAVAVGATNYANKRNNEQMLDYNRSMTQQAWERDDKYFQRSVADAEAAGDCLRVFPDKQEGQNYIFLHHLYKSEL